VNRALVDTDILSEIMRARNERVLENARKYVGAHSRFTVSAITVAEVVKGLQKALRSDALERFIDELPQFEILAVDTGVAILAGKMYAELERSGQPIGRADPLIAATASMHRLTLITGNVAHYDRIPELGFALDVANWRD
jgi:tRNA(fMet)-specific endonuclease VapC